MTGLRTLSRTRAESLTDLPPAHWTVDPDASSVAFGIRHLTVATVHGVFARFGGWLETDGSGVTAAAGTVETASISTGDAKRDAALVKEGFLDADRFPSISLSLREAALRDGELTLAADLTMKGVTRPVELTGTVARAEHGPEPIRRVRIVAAGSISRAAFGVTGGGVLESHGAIVSDTVKLSLDVVAVRKPEDGR